MTDGESFGKKIDRLQAGNEQALAEVYQQFARRLVRLARTHLDTVLQVKTGPESVVQSVFCRFYERLAGGQLKLKDENSLWRLLVMMTVRKCCKRAEKYYGPTRNARREVKQRPPWQDDSDLGQVLARDPTPEQAAFLTELVQKVMKKLDDKQQKIFVLKLESYNDREIAEKVGCSTRTVSRVLTRIREALN